MATDLIFDCLELDSAGINPRGVIVIELFITAEDTGGIVDVDPIGIELQLFGNAVPSIIVEADPIEITIAIRDNLLNFIVETVGVAWIKWSNIGALDFTVWRDNIAGERPLDWPGVVYEIRKLINKAVAYGSNGVSFLTPVANSWGLDTFHRIGLKGKGAVTGDEKKHFFVDKANKLYKLDENFAILDYSEYLSDLSSDISMSYDKYNELVYICDGSYGLVYNVLANSLGQCEINISGIGYRDSTLYVISPDDIETSVFSICTDTYDLGNRKLKTIHSLEFGTDAGVDLRASIEYRRDFQSEFKSLGWYTVTKDGISYIECTGVEFRFKLKSMRYRYFELDYIKVHGTVHSYSIDDSFRNPTL